MPTLVEAMERHGHMRLGPQIRASVLAMSASTIDRSLRQVREQASGSKRRRTAAPSSVRKSIPVRTFSDWDDPPPGFVEADLVAHCGPVANGSFVQTLTVTDIATGWTECAPLLYREQTLLREVLGQVRRRLPFELLGFDTDNDSVFVNETVRDYCRDSGIVFTRCRPWHKNDQAFVGQKNGAIVRRIVGYRRLEGLEAAAALSRLYTTTRLFVNFFQPSFKLASKRRDGARVSKRYHPPATPCQRLLADPRTPQQVRDRVAELSARLDPIRLLRQMRVRQQSIVDIVDQPVAAPSDPTVPPLEQFLAGLRVAWREGEARPTAIPVAKPKRGRRRPEDYREGKLFLRDSKNGPRTVWLSAAAREVLERLLRKNAWVFPSPYRAAEHLAEITEFWQDVRTEAGVPDVRPHDLRHTYASIALMHGETVLTIGRLLGHDHPGTTLKYTNFADAAAREAVDTVSSVLRRV